MKPIVPALCLTLLTATTLNADPAASPLVLDKLSTEIIPATQEALSFAYTASADGILMVGVRATEAGPTEDLYIVIEQLGGSLPLPLIEGDDDIQGDLSAEHVVVQVHQGLEYRIDVYAYQSPAAFHMNAAFAELPAAATIADQTEAQPLELGQVQTVEVASEQRQVFTWQSTADACFVAMTQGEGDVVLASYLRDNPEASPVLVDESDQDLGEELASEALLIRASAGQEVLLSVEGLQDSVVKLFVQEIDTPDSFEEAADLKQPSSQSVPPLTLQTLEGDYLSLLEAEQPIMVLDFWASWCVPCVRTLPKLQELSEWASEEGLPVAVYALNIGEDPETVQTFIKEQGLDLQVVLDPQSTTSLPFDIEAIPTTIIIRDGQIVKRHSGASDDFVEVLQEDLRSLLAE